MKKSLSLSLLIAGMAFSQAAFAEQLPAPADLKGKVENNKVSLSWTAPDYNGSDPVVETFDTYESYLIENVGEWKFIDGDGLSMNMLYGSNNYQTVHYGEKWAWQTLSNECYSETMKKKFAAYSGKNALATYTVFGGKNDDWAISPKLSGEEQVISFYARIFHGPGSAPFEVYYSKTGTEKEDFLLIRDDEVRSETWAKVAYTVPEGALYFAIRYIGDYDKDHYGFAIDDFSYYPDGFAAMELTGYNVYCDNKLLNTEPLTVLEFTADIDASKAHDYYVTAVYTDSKGAAVEGEHSLLYSYVPAVPVPDVDAAVTALDVPSKFMAGVAVKIGATVANNGGKVLANAKVALFVNGKEALSKEIQNLAVKAEQKVEFDFTPTALMPAESNLYVKVDAEGDDNEKDNVSETAKMNITTYGVGPEIKGAVAEGKVNITWEAPETPERIADVEDFDSYKSYIIEGIGDWAFIDGDGLPHNLIYEAETADMMNYYKPYAWQVFSNEGLPNSASLFDAHSGNKALATYAAFGGDNDDWAISPKLSGEEQVISFWGRVFGLPNQEGSAPYAVYYSTTDTKKKSFKKIRNDVMATPYWTKKEYMVPEGALYFAIRYMGSYSGNCAGFAIDDFTYFADGNKEVELLGYNIYKDGVKVNDKPLATPSFNEDADTDGGHEYQISAVYKNGESAPSNVYSYETSGVSEIGAGAVAVTVNGSVISVRGAAAVAVYSLDGVRIAAAEGDCSFDLAKGVYVVKADNKVVKAIVR